MFASVLNMGWKISPKLTSFFIKYFFFHPRSYAPSANEESLLEQSEDFWFTVHDKKIKAYKWGKGPAVLLVHGWNGRGIQFSAYIKSLIAKGCSAVAVDGPAHGESEGRHSSYFEFSDTVRTFIKSQHGRPIAGVIGHSLGASAVINCQSKDNHPVKIVLLAPALRIGTMLQQTFSRYGISSAVFEGMIRDYEKQYGYSIVKDDPIRLLKDINEKILIVHDTNDRATPYKDVRDAVAANPHIELVTTKGLGHMRLLTEDTIINRALDFLL
jgi:pimeloyl-ACP methyl ester carboxylesterase